MPPDRNSPAAPPPACPAAGRLLGVDPGARRVGLALSDESQTIAQPLATLSRRPGKRVPLRRLLDLAREHRVVGVVVGLPLEPDGGEGAAARAARDLAAAIGRLSGLPVALLDERMTTARALQAVRDMGGTTRGRRGDVDALAAALVLQQFLDGRRGSGTA